MAGKLITMGKVKQILQLSEQGVSQREISRRLNVNRKTIVHYLHISEHDHPAVSEITTHYKSSSLTRQFKIITFFSYFHL